MKTHPLEGFIEDYLSQKNISQSTIRSYKIVFKKYIRYLKENKIEFAKTSDMIHFREEGRFLGYSSQYLYIQISALRGFYRYLRVNQKRLGLSETYAYDIMGPIKNERIRHKIKKPILTINQAKHLILHTKEIRKSIWHYRDHAIIYLMMTSGLRSVEIIQAKRKDYKIVEGRQLLFVKKNGSGSNEEFVKIAKGASQAINDYLNERKDDHPFLFVTTKNTSPKGCLSRTFFRDMFARVLKDCGLENTGITPHCLRHTAAAMNLLRGGSLLQTQSHMRHACISSTLVYSNHIERMKDDSEVQIDKFILGEKSYIDYDDFEDFIQRLFEGLK